MQILLVLVHILTCVALLALVLLQQGKGAEIGAAFGSGASSTVFGSPGASSFLFKLTMGMGALFFITSLALGYSDSMLAKKTQNIVISPNAIQQQQAQQIQQQKTAVNGVVPVNGVDVAPSTPSSANSLTIGTVDKPVDDTSSNKKS
ncbi:MAG: preprotein translocase subunit SecG [Legionellales bacterium]|nr:preprotein translocase subunit SecG [Legionellales bacterium]